MHVSERTVHNWETGKVRIPYSAYKLLRILRHYELPHPAWKDWRIIGEHLVTPEGHCIHANNYHWLSLTARKAEAFTKVNQQLRELTASVINGKLKQREADKSPPLLANCVDIPTLNSAFALGLVSISTSDTENSHKQLNQGFQPPFSEPSKAEPKTTPKPRPRVFLRKRHFAQSEQSFPEPVYRSQTQQVTVGGDLC